MWQRMCRTSLVSGQCAASEESLASARMACAESWVLHPQSSVLLHAIKWPVLLLFLLLSIVQGRLLQLSRNRFRANRIARHNSMSPSLSFSLSLHMHAYSACSTVCSINHALFIVCLSQFLLIPT